MKLAESLISQLPEGTKIINCACHGIGMFSNSANLQLAESLKLRSIMHRNTNSSIPVDVFVKFGGKLIPVTS